MSFVSPDPEPRAIPHFESVGDTLPITFFEDFAAREKREEPYTLPALAQRIRTITAGRKGDLPWLKLAKFGDLRSDKQSLRHDENVLAITGIEADYDGGRVHFEDAVERVAQAGLSCLVYTSPSHTEDTPRWRVLCPTSTELPPDRRNHLLGRLNGLFGGIFSGESWTLSQSYYFGSVNHNPSHQVEVCEGHCIDQLDELDEVWIGKPQTGTETTKDGLKVSGPINEQALLAAITSGESYHEAKIRLLGKWAREGVPYMEARERLRAAFDQVPLESRDERWRAREGDLDRCLEDIFVKEAKAKDRGEREPKNNMEAPAAPLTIINPVSLFLQPVPPREWIVEDWLPVGHVTLSYGDGGVGKTLLAQQLMTSCATGKRWCGLAVTQCRAFGLFCEDDADELHRRQDAINDVYGIGFDGLDGMRWVSAVGQDNVLVRFDRDGIPLLTDRYHQVEQAALAHGARLVLIDTAADTLGGNENDRTQVRAFIGFVLNGLARKIGGAVLLNAHPSRSGMAAGGSMDGGSTGWSNTARSRWALTRPQAEEGQPPDTNARILSRKKANYAARDDEIKLTWRRGVLVTENAPADVMGAIQRAGAEEVFLTLLERCTASNMPLSSFNTAGNYAPKVFAKRPDAAGYKRPEFERALGALMASGKIVLESYGRKSDERRRIMRVEEVSPEDEIAA